MGSRAYYVMLGAVAIFVLGPLGGISAAFMNFSLGFFVGGQVLAGILGSAVTYGYGPEGKHGANYMQTMAASVAQMAAMGVVLQAMVWLGLPEPPVWKMVLYFICIGMFSIGVGMLYTPILVDRMQLTYPSGFAVANILRALTDKALLNQSIRKLGGGTLAGLLGGVATLKVSAIEALGISTSTIGAGMIVGARIAIPAFVVGLIGYSITPWLRTIGWLGENDPFRKIGFILALGTILGAAIVDLAVIAYQAFQRLTQRGQEPVEPTPDWKRVNTVRLVAWVAAWGIALILVASNILQQPLLFVAMAVGLIFIFVLVNGISTGISDWNPISSAFVVSVILMTLVGLRDPGVGLMCASILLAGCGVGVDMQQDRSTGWRLGSNRLIQFRYQAIGIFMGALLAVGLAKVFMNAYPVLQIDTFSNPTTEGAQQWQSAMTYKLVGVLKGLTNPQPYIIKGLLIGIGIGFATELLRKLIKRSSKYQTFVRSGKTGAVTDFALDAIVLPSPYASSFGGFVNLITTVWWILGGIVSSLLEAFLNRRRALGQSDQSKIEIPADMSTTSLIGGGLIAGDSLAALSVGVIGLLRALL
ncbi:MAG: OPT/YSL family transporter [Verrucomicrobia bacterium]|nr:OPT/YSL family transporter [Verrucomicrobiota bacterium]